MILHYHHLLNRDHLELNVHNISAVTHLYQTLRVFILAPHKLPKGWFPKKEKWNGMDPPSQHPGKPTTRLTSKVFSLERL